MKEIKDIDLKLCEFQGSLFEESINYFNCGTPQFIKIFMNSDLALRMDDPAFMMESNDTRVYLEELKKNYKLNRGKDKYPHNVMVWIGYLYRYFSILYGFSSKKVYKIIKPKELYGLYDSYHSLDPKEAIKRIIESKNIKTEINLIEIAKKYYL